MQSIRWASLLYELIVSRPQVLTSSTKKRKVKCRQFLQRSIGVKEMPLLRTTLLYTVLATVYHKTLSINVSFLFCVRFKECASAYLCFIFPSFVCVVTRCKKAVSCSIAEAGAAILKARFFRNLGATWMSARWPTSTSKRAFILERHLKRDVAWRSSAQLSELHDRVGHALPTTSIDDRGCP